MSRIERMQIQGIRSFGPQTGETIVFNTPLTLIVGWNGSGKTTIIECLKYATTGELPPNSKTGGAFIHDPKLTSYDEVMAQVKLSFRRKMQLNVRKNARSQKTLEGSLLMRRNGVKESISSRVAELDQIVPQYLGVSNLWPMNKYTKAIENIKVIRKVQEENAKENQTRATKAEADMVKLSDKIEAYRTEHETAEAAAKEALKKNREAYAHAAKYEQVVAQLQGKRMMEETDQELQVMMEQYGERTQYRSYQTSLQQNRTSLGTKQSEVGKHQAEKDQHARNIQKRANLIKETARRHGIRGFDLDVDETQVVEFQQILRKLSRDQNKALEHAVNRLSEEKAGLNQRKDLSKSQITANDKRITELQKIMSNIRATEKDLDKASADADNADYDTRIQNIENTVHRLENQKERLDTELVEATQNKLKETKQSLSTMNAFRDVLAQKNNDVKDAEEKHSEQKNKRAEYTKYKNVVLDAIRKEDITDFDDTLSELESDFGAQLKYFEACLDTAETHNQCRLCMRTLKDDKAEGFTKAAFLIRVKNMVAKATQNLDANIDDVQAELEKVRNAKPSYELAKRAEEVELPALKAEHEKLVTINELKESKREIDSSYDEARELEDRVVALKKKQKTKLQKVNTESRTAKAELAALSGEREKLRKTVSTLELRIRDINAELSAAQSSLKEKRNLAERIEEFKNSNTEQREVIRSLETDLLALDPELERAQATYKDVNRRGNERVNRVQEEASKLSDNISAYIDKGGPQRLTRAQHEIEILLVDIKQIEDDMSRVARDVKKIEEALSSVEHTKQSIFDNLRYRKAKRTLETLAKEIEALEKQNAEADQAHWTAEGDKWDAEYQLLHVRVIELSTTMKQLDMQLVQDTKEYNKYYKNAANDYRKAHITVETTKAACDDLSRYGSALEQAILKFHTIKMDEINKIIDELWRNAYQGTDVDTVRIRSDNDGGARNRTTNYRVVMVKRDNEMDMRGRCSAGQKVLASIVIRLALAECFGTNCGLIALDEPTTNLDQQNIRGLAESLSQIIQIRRKQANFQLLVITHDEQFLREMNCADYTDVYWRVGRDKEQQSYIERQNIAEYVFTVSDNDYDLIRLAGILILDTSQDDGHYESAWPSVGHWYNHVRGKGMIKREAYSSIVEYFKTIKEEISREEFALPVFLREDWQPDYDVETTGHWPWKLKRYCQDYQRYLQETMSPDHPPDEEDNDARFIAVSDATWDALEMLEYKTWRVSFVDNLLKQIRRYVWSIIDSSCCRLGAGSGGRRVKGSCGFTYQICLCR
ncbi:P-loop containing nucleoside triphosphate hydrolase protein [Paraphaeosphaeria sporulosa]|uniref:p-loop containing nucleoside triphosphate hydrolase protein n=1 Tax=Paraphaeosphaeria sporulosa TaxID=1460663 RepID=A0A177CF29_9PLEO|nr:P-loop containing nucleoside triphosphate hydrolase protein [Paraphaeosphaeria sporulosa]OAG05936.1 P-loop containing nucleoside triphosphate hydrolase protein [Paraphaeosphaeria sporulosa]